MLFTSRPKSSNKSKTTSKVVHWPNSSKANSPINRALLEKNKTPAAFSSIKTAKKSTIKTPKSVVRSYSVPTYTKSVVRSYSAPTSQAPSLLFKRQRPSAFAKINTPKPDFNKRITSPERRIIKAIKATKPEKFQRWKGGEKN
jgi:hypothetical protein